MSRRGLGFVTDPRRINVALTRATSLLIIVMNTQTFEADPTIWRKYIALARKEGIIYPVRDLRGNLQWCLTREW